MEAALEALREDVATCSALEQELRGKAAEPKPRAGKARAQPQAGAKARALEDVLGTCVLACKESRKRAREEQQPAQDLSDEALSQYTRFTKHTALKPYEPFLHYVPRLVNVRRPPASYTHALPGVPRSDSRRQVVTLAEALPVAGSGITLPLNLQAIASRCKGCAAPARGSRGPRSAARGRRRPALSQGFLRAPSLRGESLLLEARRALAPTSVLLRRPCSWPSRRRAAAF
jgi:hypothetical protein